MRTFKHLPRTGDKFYTKWADGSKHLAEINWISLGYKYVGTDGGNVLSSGKMKKGEKRRGWDAWGKKLKGKQVPNRGIS